MTDSTSAGGAVAVLGAGLMGAAMATRLGEQGFLVSLWNRSPERARAAAGEGVAAVDALPDALRGATVALTMLRDGDAVEEVVRAALPALRDGSVVWVQSSTVGVDAADRLRGLADDAGVAYLDAPVLGSTGPAGQGSLTWLVGGPVDVLQRARPVLEALGSVRHVGDRQEGSRLKLVLNTWLTTATVAMADALAALDTLDVPSEEFLTILRDGPLGMAYAVQKAALMTGHQYAAGFPVELALKDVRLGLDSVGGQALAEAVAARLQATADAGYARADLAAVAELSQRGPRS